MKQPAPSRAPWTALVMRVPATHEELLVGCLSEFLQGERRIDGPKDSADGRGEVELWLYLHSSTTSDEAFAAAGGWLKRTGLDPEACGLRAEIVEDGRWVERYQASLQPFDLGREYRVYPSGDVDPSPTSRRPLILIPGRAFGTGEHPTTRLCTSALERSVTAGSRWVDIGCGTAILSIVARGCGAEVVLALDSDPEAVAVAHEVLAVNGIEGVDVRQGSVADAADATWDGVVVNISAPFVLAHAEPLARLPGPGGTLLASGFMARDLDTMCGAFGAAGLECLRTDVEEPWGLAVFRRPD